VSRVARDRTDEFQGPGRDRRQPGWTRIQRMPDSPLAVALVRVADLQLHAATRRSEPIAGDGDERPLPDHVPAETDPAAALELEAHPRCLGQGPMKGGSQAARLEDHEARPDPTSSSRQAAQERLLGGRKPARQVDHQEFRAPSSQQGSGHPQSLGHVGRAKEEQPVEVHAPGDRLQGIEGATEVQVGGDRSASLRLGDEPQGEGRLPARFVPPEGDAGFAIQPSGAEDRVERGEAGRDRPFAEWGEWIGGVRPGGRRREEDRRQGALGGNRCARCEAAAEADRGTSPAVLEMNKGLGQGFARGHHGPSNDRTGVLYVKPVADG